MQSLDGDLPLEDDAPIAEHQRETIEWLKQFKHTGTLQRLVAKHKWSAEELEFLKANWILVPRKKQEKANAIRWS